MPHNDSFYSPVEEYLCKFLHQIMKDNDIPGVASALIEDGKIINFEFGVKDSVSQEPGSKFFYSGESFRYLGHVQEHITGVSLSTL